MTSTRRDFLKTAAASGGVIAWSFGVPAFLRRAAALAPDAGKPGAKDTLLVVIEFTGVRHRRCTAPARAMNWLSRSIAG